VGLILGADLIKKIWQVGIWDSIAGYQDGRETLVWFLYSGLAMMVMGVILGRMIQRNEQHYSRTDFRGMAADPPRTDFSEN